ncbi:hypothetical protein [uncultured Roseivirga sp.]|uniref:hypothetical protein n=1 Tax=uncultured Roseivirga sp. TaxID=543088 RepID=UPI0030DB2483|tara:strand:- start:5065 stop:5475 length:411 start_codon:yes stop_codon:yes gene_type:complete
MEPHFQLSDTEFNRQFTDCSLNPELFSHEAHIRLAWINIKKLGLEKAIDNTQTQLENFVAHIGAKDKYHKTLTIVAIKIVNHFIQKSKSDDFSNFINEFSQLKYEFKELVNAHYSFNIFNSDEARTEFLKPDLLEF